MLSDLDICGVLLNLYGKQDAFERVLDVDGVYAAVKYNLDSTLIAFRGSTTFLDWIRDFQACMVPTSVGSVELGFYHGLRGVLQNILPGLPKGMPVQVAGHSLGGGRALIFGALLVEAGYTPEIITFGAPRPGDAQLTKTLKDCAITAYKNGVDYVTDVPIPIHPLLPYEHPRYLTALLEYPDPDDEWGILAWHHLQLYQKGLQNGQANSHTAKP